MISRDEFEAKVAQIPYQYKHPPLLAALIRWLEPESVVEVGSHIGFAACHMARALQENGHGHLTCVDPFAWTNDTQSEQWHENIKSCGVEDFVTLIEGRSQEVTWPEKVDLAFIDGNHTYASCKYDTEKACELGATTIILHDTSSFEGPRRYSEQMRKLWINWDFLEVDFEQGLTIAKKRTPKGPILNTDEDEIWPKS